jgi:hypothetical protein
MKFKVGSPVSLNIPAVFLRNVSKIGIDKVREAIAPFKHERLQFTYRSKDIPGDLAVVYFASEADAMNCLSKIKNIRIDHKRLYSSYR